MPIDLGCIDIPVIFIASKDDHIAPWKGVYDGVKLFKSSKSFILSGSGHVAGMINPPSDHKYHYWINNETPDTAGRVAQECPATHGKLVANLETVVRSKPP